MAYVEEEIPDEPITVPPDSLLYIVLEHQDRPNTNLPATATSIAMEGVTCIVQEEIPWDECSVEPPPPTSTTTRESHSPCFPMLEHLELIFEM
jgi:hypothetical protein